MSSLTDISSIIETGITIFRDGVYFVECFEKMQEVITIVGMTSATVYAVGSYGYKSGKVIYNLFSNHNGQSVLLEVGDDDIPDRFKCAVTGKVMVCPVVCPQEAYFEKASRQFRQLGFAQYIVGNSSEK